MDSTDKSQNNLRIFKVGQEFNITYYPKNKVMKLRIVGRNNNRVSYTIDDGEVKEYRVNRVSYPPSESLLIDDYSAVFSYNYIGCDDIRFND